MLIFILILILIAILYSTDRGRELLEDILLLPFKIIGYPFRLAREQKERMEEERFAQEESDEKEKIKKLLSKRQLETLDEEKFETSWRYDKEQIIQQVKFFEIILEGGTDPRILNLEENFSYIKSEVFNKAKKDLLKNNMPREKEKENLTPKILQNIRKKTQDTPLQYELIRQKLGRISHIGKQTQGRIEQAIGEEKALSKERVAEITKFVMENLE